jgi:hypothetical protein
MHDENLILEHKHLLTFCLHENTKLLTLGAVAMAVQVEKQMQDMRGALL